MMLEGKGLLIYDPKDRGNLAASWWAILEVDEELRRFYASMYEKANSVSLVKPRWPAHVSVVKGEEPLNKEPWGRYHNKEIGFHYTPEEVQDDIGREEKGYVWLRIISEELAEIRRELGLSAKPYESKVGYHITLGRYLVL